MIETQTLATILLVLRFVSTALIVATVVRQIHNIRTLRTQFPAVRYMVLFMTVVILLGQVIPIFIDYSAAYDTAYVAPGEKTGGLLAAYTLNNALSDIVVGALLAYLHFRIPSRRTEASDDIKQAL